MGQIYPISGSGHFWPVVDRTRAKNLINMLNYFDLIDFYAGIEWIDPKFLAVMVLVVPSLKSLYLLYEAKIQRITVFFYFITLTLKVIKIPNKYFYLSIK